MSHRCHGAQDGWAERAGLGLPFGRLIDPKEVARTVAFIASEDSGLITGANIDYDQIKCFICVFGGCNREGEGVGALGSTI